MDNKGKACESDEYKWMNVQGVQSIVWLFTSNARSKKETVRRQQLKDKVGKIHVDTVMLDTKRKGSHYTYCDVLIFSENIKTWETVIKQHFKNYDLKVRAVNGGHQVTFTNNPTGELFFTASFYLGGNKLMIQPGQRKEENILKWLKAFPQIRGLYTQYHPRSSGATPKLVDNTAERGVTKTYAEVIANKSDDPALTSDLYVDLPPIGGSATVGSSNSIHNPIIINEVLCFAQNKTNTLPVDNVVKLCTDFYSSEVISAAKRVLFDNAKGKKPRYVVRQGENKSRGDMRDIVTLLLSLELAHTPIFVARDLANLPPLSVCDFDVVKILQDIDTVKQNVKLLSDGQASMAKLMKENTGLPAPPSGLHQTTVFHSPQSDVSPQSVEDDENYIVLDYTSCSSSDYSNGHDDTLQDDMHFASSLQMTQNEQLHPVSPGWRVQEGKGRNNRQHSSTPTSSHGKQHHKSHESSYLPMNRSDARSNQDRRHKDVIYGAGLSSEIRVATHRRDSKREVAKQDHKTVTGVFITRLDPRISPRKIQDYIKRETGIHVNVEKLDTKYNTYSSFYVPADKQVRATLLNAWLWPEGAMLKPFYS